MAYTYPVGATAKVPAEFRVDGVLTDPDTVTATAERPDGTTLTPTVTTTGAGKRSISWTLDQAGDWILRVVSTGAAAGVQETFLHTRRSGIGENLIAEALVSIGDMLFFLDRIGSEPDLNEIRWLEDLINAYSLACARYCNRQFTPERTAAAGRWALKTDVLAEGISKTFRYDGSGYLSLAPYEIRTIDAVIAGANLPASQQVTLFPGDANREAEYDPEPAARTNLGTFRWLTVQEAPYMRALSTSVAGLRGAPRVKVTGDWGPAVGIVPPDVAHACKIAVGDAFRNPEDYARRAAAGLTVEEIPPEGPGSLPRASLRLLASYQLP